MLKLWNDIEVNIMTKDFFANPTNLIAIFAFLVSVVSIIIGFLGLWIQRLHNQLSVKPIGNIGIRDYADLLLISVSNAGTGPMIIKSVETSNSEGNKLNYPIEWIPMTLKPKISFLINLENTAILNGTGANILEYHLDPAKINEAKERDAIRLILKNLTIRIKYMDIYGKEQPEITKNLDWFGRER
jgi:hypothetical protein